MPERDGRNLDAVLRSGLAGGIAGCIAKTAIAPLDRVKILFQTSNPDFRRYTGTWTGVFSAGRAIYADGGARALLQGHSATLIRVFPYAAIKFMAYDAVKPVLMPTPDKKTNVRRFTAGAIAGCSSVFFTYPLELIRIRMAFETRHAQSALLPSEHHPTGAPRPSLRHVITLIYNEGNVHNTGAPVSVSTPSRAAAIFDHVPILKFYRGFTVTIVGMVPYAGTSFLVWGYLRSRLLAPAQPTPTSPDKRASTPLADLAIGAVSGMLAQTASYPFEVVRRRMQVGGLTSPGRWMRWGETVRSVYRDAATRGTAGAGRAAGWAYYSAGLRGFYVGLTIGYLKVVPMTAVSYMVWEAGKRILKV